LGWWYTLVFGQFLIWYIQTEGYRFQKNEFTPDNDQTYTLKHCFVNCDGRWFMSRPAHHAEDCTLQTITENVLSLLRNENPYGLQDYSKTFTVSHMSSAGRKIYS